MSQDEELYLQATQEVENEVIDAALWAKSMALAEGDTKIVKYKYIKLRVEQFKLRSGIEEEKGQRKETIESEGVQPKGNIERERVWQEEKLENEIIQQEKTLADKKIQEEKRLAIEKSRQEELREIERARQERRIENEKIQQEKSEIISGLSELGCEMKKSLFGGWKIREPLGGVVNVRTIEEAKEFYQNKKPGKMEKKQTAHT